ncbi:hypothetical protein [Burkholderia cepacia]|uniref:hypothetical protein n=1 Tax=Burkholderia cepacia TaxID=292 RepID=UPI000F5DF91D|nr:hypothetical protein [Burkholderia cepacia]RQZ98978.1 hypothetical protein DF055_25415 [Burkholderia cepacia]RRA03034.1 hypothetical protein DF054_26635 [Burkholderia cepacia]
MVDKQYLIDLVKAEESSTRRLLKFLEVVRGHPADFSSWPGLAKATSSQGALAAFGDVMLEICPCSLNTLKKRAQNELAAGWQVLDFARQRANDAICRKQTAPICDSKFGRGTKAELQQKLKELSHDYRQLQIDNWQLIKGIRRLLSNADSIMEQFPHDALIKQMRTERTEILAMFSLLSQPVVRRDEENEA